MKFSRGGHFAENFIKNFSEISVINIISRCFSVYLASK